MRLRHLGWFALAIATATILVPACSYTPPDPNSCEVDDVQLCGYDGPEESLGKGTCRASVKLCGEDAEWGQCSEQVVPTVEACDNTDDPNCDGYSGCTGTPLRAGPELKLPKQDLVLSASAADGYGGFDGPVYAVGFRDQVVNGNGEATSSNVLFLRRNPDGSIDDWSDKFGFVLKNTAPNLEGGAFATAVSMNQVTNRIVVAGTYRNGKLTIDGRDLGTEVDNPTGFVATFDTDGNVEVTQALGGLGIAGLGGDGVNIAALATDAKGNVYVTGTYLGSPKFGEFELPSATFNDGFVLAYSSDLTPRWVRGFAGNLRESVDAITIAGIADPVVALSFNGSLAIDEAGGSVASYEASLSRDIALVRLNPETGYAIWSDRVECGTGCRVGGLAAKGNTVAFAGIYTGEAKFGGTSYDSDANDPADSFVALYNIQSGMQEDLVSFRDEGGTGAQEVNGVVIDSFGDIVVTGHFSEGLTVDGVALQSAGIGDVNAFVVKLRPNLKTYWGRSFGDGSYQQSHAITLGKTTGHVFIGGGFQGQLTGATPVLSASGQLDPFLVETTN